MDTQGERESFEYEQPVEESKLTSPEKIQPLRSENRRRRSSILRRSSRGGTHGLSEEDAQLYRLMAGCDDSFVSAESSSDEFFSVPTSPMQPERFTLGALDDSEIVDGVDSLLDEDYNFDIDGIPVEACANFHMHADDSDDGADSFSGYDEEFFPDVMDNLNSESLVEAVKNGASEEELLRIAEAAMAEQMEKDLQNILSTGSGARSGSASPIKLGNLSPQALLSEQASPSGDLAGRTLSEIGGISGRMTPAANGSISGRMTPALAAGGLSGLMTPRLSSGLASPPAGSTFAEEVSCKLQASCEKQAATRARRSSAMMHSSIKQAAKRLSLQHDHSLKRQEEREIGNGEDRSRLRQSIAGARKDKRKSILKAAEVLEAAGIGVEAADGSAEASDDKVVAEQLAKVQIALEGAQRRHRKSILCALQKVSGNSEACEEEDKTEADIAEPLTSYCKPSSGRALPRARVEEVVAAFYLRQQQAKAEGTTINGSKRRVKKPAADFGNPRALLNTRVESDSTVHCGPARHPRARR